MAYKKSETYVPREYEARVLPVDREIRLSNTLWRNYHFSTLINIMWQSVHLEECCNKRAKEILTRNRWSSLSCCERPVQTPPAACCITSHILYMA